MGTQTLGRLGRGTGRIYDRAESRLKNSDSTTAKVTRGLGTAANVMTLGTLSSANRATRESLKKMENARYGASESLGEREKYFVERNKNLGAVRKEVEENKAIRKGTAKGVTDASPEAQELARKVNQMSDKNLEAQYTSTIINNNFVQALSPRQVEFLLEKSNKSETEKTQIRDARFAPLKKALEDVVRIPSKITNDAAFQRVRGLSDKEIELLDPKFFEGPEGQEFINTLSTGQYDSIMKNSKFTPQQKTEARKKRSQPLDAAIAAGNAAAVKQALTRLGNSEVSKLPSFGPDPVIANPLVVANLTPKMLEKIADEVANSAVLTKIANQIRTNPTHPAHRWITGPVGSTMYT